MKHLMLFESFIDDSYIREALEAYLTCAIWTDEESIMNDDEDDGDELDGMDLGFFSGEEKEDISLNVDMFTDEARIKAKRDIREFIRISNEYLGRELTADDIEASQLGHDFWLSRNGHGAGFYDRSYLEEDVKDALVKASDYDHFKHVDLEYWENELYFN